MAHDDDPLTGAIPEPDAAPSASERSQARRFADLVDKALAGRAPPAMSADDRALLEVATIVRATHGRAELPAARQAAVVEDALRLAVGAAAPAGSPSARFAAPAAPAPRLAPWLVTGA